jgi:hypothetical protein
MFVGGSTTEMTDTWGEDGKQAQSESGISL